VWRGLIPRNKGSRDRISNLWCKITLGKLAKSELNGIQYEDELSILHDLAVNYTG
jgi:hypothetical protein